MARIAEIFLLLVVCHVFCEGFHFTLETIAPDPEGNSTGRQACGVLRCTETLKDAPGGQDVQLRKLTSLTVSKKRLHAGDSGGRWQQLASVTPRQPALDRVSDGVKVTGQLLDQNAELSLELVKTHDCQESQFSCVAVSVDYQGRTSTTTSLVGKAVDSQRDFGPRPATRTVSAQRSYGSSGDQQDADAHLAQLANFFQMRFDWIGSRLDGSLKALENRLEDRVGDLGATLDSKISNLGNRVEDKLTNLHIRVTDGFGQMRYQKSDCGNACDQLALKLDGLENELENKMATCVAEVSKQNNSREDATGNMSDQLATVIASVRSIQDNLTCYGENIEKLETATNQCALAATSEDIKLTDLVSSVSGLSRLTQNLVSQVSTLSNSYAGGALVPVEEFTDPLGTGKKEWRLVFRGTAYNNVQVYPAYMHGTGIPLEVEEGCKQFNSSLPCVNHYRNRDAFRNWAHIDQVLFAVYKDDRVVHSVLFNGKGSTHTSWFAAGRVFRSSWADLTTEPHNYFSIKGQQAVNPAHSRIFYVNRDHHNGCNGFRGWFYAKDELKAGCTADQTVSVPIFQYAVGSTFSVWTGPSVARADAIGVFLKYE